MAHEIQTHDNVVLHSKPAWHGLGVLVDEAPTPRDALTIAGIDWGVVQRDVYDFDENGDKVIVPGYKTNRRADVPGKDGFLGLVSANYVPIQNYEVADFCEALLGADADTKVLCETAGSIRNGKRIWFLLKGAPFEVAKGDQMFPYILVSNGHDGRTTFRVTPTTIRVVCSNTLHATIPDYDTGALGDSAITIRHTVNVMERIEEARRALRQYGAALEEEKKLIDFMSKKEVSSEDLKRFFLACYTEHFGEVPTNPTSKVQQNQFDKMQSAFGSFSRRFDDEKGIAGTSWWGAFNAYSGLVQHDQKARGKGDTDRFEKKVESNLFGLAQTRTQRAMQLAFKAAVSA